VLLCRFHLQNLISYTNITNFKAILFSFIRHNIFQHKQLYFVRLLTVRFQPCDLLAMGRRHGNPAPAPEYWSKGGMGSLGEGTWRARRTRAYNGGLGAEPPAGSRGRAPGQGA